MADPKTANRAKRESRQTPVRMRRDRARAEAAMRDRRRAVSRGIDMSVTLIALLTALFLAGGLLLCAVRVEGSVDMRALRLLAAMAPLTLMTTLVLPRFLPIEPLMMALSNFLCSVGVVILYTVSPERGVRQTNFYIMGLAAMIMVSMIVSKMRRFRGLTWLAMILGIGALVMPLVFGEWNNGAKNWVELPLLGSFQPSELVKLSLVLAMAYYFSAHRTVLQMMPAILFAGACLLLLMLQRDLGTALIYYAATLVMFYVACGNVPLTVIGLGGGAAAAMLGYKMFAHVKVRVAMWRNPWSDPLDKGYQIIQALLAIGSGGLFGLGIGQGTPEKIPAYYNDFIFAVICEQLGLVFGLLIIAVYVLLALRGVSVISRSRRSFDMLLGCGVLAMLVIQMFMIVGGVIKMLPLTGVTMPMLSYGGSSLISCLMMVGILHGISARAQENMEEDVLSRRG
ncbi:MAG: FtsW/RodA/SpoVE family cell cycle protein [Clostridia bacterium]|nr:FtsW/RodA/SpoVE family cell cycle protein [Clostridia bacterium]